MFAVKALVLGLFCCLALASPAWAGYEESPRDSHRERTWRIPLDGPFGSPFGYRWGRMHQGIDIEAWAETRVRAAQSGVVTKVGWLNGYSGFGLVVKIRHERRIVTMYAHLSRALVRRGERVTAGQLIGRAGCTGSCTGTHLHFQMWDRGKLVDPLKFLGRDAFSRR
ncbi:MAG TPA: M23 family metallopeptidase [Candidatus Limnocylindrales bacterium]|nr:M23 family metallopeptidase [Candidatus Limnocylindrales bacterium]